MLRQLLQAAHRLGLLARLLERIGLRHIVTHHQGDQGQQGAAHEGNAPAPFTQLGVGEQEMLQHQQQHQGQQLAADQGHVLEAGVEAAPLRVRHLRQVSRAGAVFAAQAQALQQARQQQDAGRQDAGGGIGRRAGDQERAGAHQQDRRHQGHLAAMAVAQVAEQDAADRAHEEAQGEDAGGRHHLGRGVLGREKGIGEVQGEGRVAVEVEPLDQVAGRADEDGAQARAGNRLGGHRLGAGDRIADGCCHWVSPRSEISLSAPVEAGTSAILARTPP